MPTNPQPTIPHAEHGAGGVSVNSTKPNGPSPADIFRAAVAAGNLTRDERIAHRCACALVAAQDEIRRSEASPQMELVG